MFEKYEKFWVLAIIALVVYYFYKKGSPAKQAAGMGSNAAVDPFYGLDFANPPEYQAAPGSIVNTAVEPGFVQPAQSSGPVVFRPAQPSTVPMSQKISAGEYTWYPAPPTLRIGARQYMN